MFVIMFAETGLLIGRRTGEAVLRKTRNRYLRAGAERASELLSRYGCRKAVVPARFVPVVRTVLNPLMGITGMPGGQLPIELVRSRSVPRSVR